MNPRLTVWSIFAEERQILCGLNSRLHQWCSSQNHVALERLAYDEVLSRESAKGQHPDLILLNSTRRGEFSCNQLQRIVGKHPLSLILEITGEWCIGDTRSGAPLPIACRFDTTVAQRRLASILVSRQHFLQIRSELNPLASLAELSNFWSRNRFTSNPGGLNLVSSDRVDRCGLQELLLQEGFKVHCYSKLSAIAEESRYLPTVLCTSGRHELKGSLLKQYLTPIVVITSHFNELDETFFEAASSMTLLKKPFLIHDLVSVIGNVDSLASANVA